MVSFKPKTDEEIAQEGRIPEGEYDFEIVEAYDDVSKKGNDMIVVKMKVFRGDEDGSFIYLHDWLVPEKFMKKVKDICRATNIMDIYESGELDPADLMGKSGKVHIKCEPDSQYNEIGNYVWDSSVVDTQTQKAREEKLDDEIPF